LFRIVPAFAKLTARDEFSRQLGFSPTNLCAYQDFPPITYHLSPITFFQPLREICIVIRRSRRGFHAELQAVTQMHTKENEDRF